MKEITNAVNQDVQQCDNRDIHHLVDHIPLYLVEKIFDTTIIRVIESFNSKDYLCTDPDFLRLYQPEWNGLRGVGMMVSRVEKGGSVTEEKQLLHHIAY